MSSGPLPTSIVFNTPCAHASLKFENPIIAREKKRESLKTS